MAKSRGTKKERGIEIIFWVYYIFSLLFALAAVIWIFLMYILDWKDSVTIFDLFMAVAFILGAIYLRINAFYYHSLLKKTAKKTIKKNRVRAEKVNERRR